MPLIEQLKQFTVRWPGEPHHNLQRSRPPKAMLRQAVVGASIVGLAAAAAAVVSRSRQGADLPDPQQHFDPAEANRQDRELAPAPTPAEGFSFATHAASLALAVAGRRKRANEAPWYALSAPLIAAPAALVSAGYILNRLTGRETSWSGLGLTMALSHIATFSFTLCESRKALEVARQWLRAVPPSYRYH